MKLTKNQLRELQIYNPHNLASSGQSKLYIGYTPGEEGLLAHYPHWVVVGVGFKVAPNGHWRDNGNKQFSVDCRANKVLELNEAIDWCFRNFKISKDQWEKDPFGGYQIKGTMQKAIDIKRSRSE